jgi:hypothetical protein
MSKVSQNKTLVVLASFACVMVWILFISRTNPKNSIMNAYPYSSIAIYGLPVVGIMYHAFIKIRELDRADYREEDSRVKIVNEMKEEKNLANVIPVIVFGVGVLLNTQLVSKDIVRATIPLLLLSLLLGTLIPYIIMYNSFDDSNITKLLVSEVVLFSSESFAFAILILCVLIPYFSLTA